jgi:hypothetical protein
MEFYCDEPACSGHKPLTAVASGSNGVVNYLQQQATLPGLLPLQA